MSETTPAQVADWIRAYVAQASIEEAVDAFVAHVDAAILADLPELASDPVLIAALHASTRSQFQVFLSLLERERPEVLLPPQAVDLALAIARRQLDLGVLLKVYRVANASVWEFFTNVAHDVPPDGPDRTEVLIYLWSHAGTWINEVVEQLIGVFYEEREKAMHGTLARRTETVHALVRGDEIGIDNASADLTYPLRGLQTAMVLWSGEDSSDNALLGLNQIATTAGSAISGQVLTVPAGRAEVWCWLATRSPVDDGVLREALLTSCEDTGARASIGTTVPGVDGFRQSHREAVDAQRFAVAVAGQERCIAYADVELACLVAGNEPGIRAFIRRELAGLAGSGSGPETLRETVAAYLASGGNVDHTATALFVHKNTIRYRLGRAEELLGHPLAERRTELALALRCLDRYGDPGGA